MCTYKSINDGIFRDMAEKDAGGGRETGNLFGVALVIHSESAVYVPLNIVIVNSGSFQPVTAAQLTLPSTRGLR